MGCMGMDQMLRSCLSSCSVPSNANPPWLCWMAVTVRFVWVRVGLYHILHLGKKNGIRKNIKSCTMTSLYGLLVKWQEMSASLVLPEASNCPCSSSRWLIKLSMKCTYFCLCNIILTILIHTFQYFIEKVFLTAVWPKFFITICFPSLNM